MDDQPSRRPLTKRQLRIAAALVGAAAGLGCYFAPPEHQTICHLAAKIVTVLLGAP